MRLLEASSIKLHEFHGDAIPKYAILSHTWGEDEVTFQALQQRNRPPYRAIISRNGIPEEVVIEELLDQADETGLGWQKIKRCCALAASRGYRYVWIDTCCINKESSAELTEAINSMFRWYEDAGTCFAYLGDVLGDSGDPKAPESAFRRSRWFTRAWTLQELLAPDSLEFFSADWKSIATKDSLAEVISAQTGIPFSIGYWQHASVAAKMSWAAQRNCLRVEDRAYSLLGLFDINMPLLYGEGPQAFRRLQLEILQKSNDDSIFAWTADERSSWLLADSPTRFAECGDINIQDFGLYRSHYSMTSMGLQVEAHLFALPKDEQGRELYILPLRCFRFPNYSHRHWIEYTVPWPLVLDSWTRPDLFYCRRLPTDEKLKCEWRNVWQKYEREKGMSSEAKGNENVVTKTKKRTIYLQRI